MSDKHPCQEDLEPEQFVRSAASVTHLSPARIALIYALVSLTWIYFSDQVIEYFIHDPAALTRLQTYKGGGFILLSAGMLHGLIRRLLNKARVSEQNLKALIANIPEAILVIDQDYRCVKANRQASLLFDLRVDELFVPLMEVAKKARIVEAPEDEPLESIASRTLNGECLRDLERTFQGPEGHPIFVRINTAPVITASLPRPERAVIMFEDITPIKRLEQLRDEFLSTAAHELKSPMATIKAYVQFLQRSRPEGIGEKELQSFAVLDRQCDRMDKLVRELVEFSRLQLGRLELNPENFDLAELCAQVAAQMQKISAKHEIRCELKDSLRIVADPGRIEQVLVNLVDNAIKFSPDGGAVRISMENDARGVIVSVADEGLGIPAEKREFLFKRYFRAHAGLTGYPASGMGMGLFISKELIRRHGGRIWHENAEPRGSVFRFSLPVDKAGS